MTHSFIDTFQFFIQCLPAIFLSCKWLICTVFPVNFVLCICDLTFVGLFYTSIVYNVFINIYFHDFLLFFLRPQEFQVKCDISHRCVFIQSRRHGGALVGLAPQTKLQVPPN